MSERYTRVTAPAGFDGLDTRRDYYFKTQSAAGDFRVRVKLWKMEKAFSRMGWEPWATKADLQALEERLREFIAATLKTKQ